MVDKKYRFYTIYYLNSCISMYLLCILLEYKKFINLLNVFSLTQKPEMFIYKHDHSMLSKQINYKFIMADPNQFDKYVTNSKVR